MPPHVRPPTRHQAGFTVLELLVALVLVSAILGGILGLTRSTLSFTGLTTSIATSVEDVAQAEGYLADTFRTAKSVFTAEELLDTGGASLVNCATATAGRCIAVVTPVADLDATGQPIIDFDLSFFSVEPIGTRFEGAGLPRGWDGENTLAILEYRVENICTIAGTAPCTKPPSTLSAAQRTHTGEVGILAGGVSATDAAGDPVETFQVVTTTAGGATSLVLQIVSRADSSVGQPFTVRETPVELQVSVRGLGE